MTETDSHRQLVRAMLLSSRLNRFADVEEPEGVEPNFSYNATITAIQHRDDFTFAFAALKVEQQIQEKVLTEFSTLYLLGFQGDRFTSDDAEFAFLENLVEVAIWPRFRDLCELTVSQAELEFPRLPLKPDTIAKPKGKVQKP